MLNIIYLPTGTIVSSHSEIADANRALAMIDTVPSSHEIVGEPDVDEAVDVAE